MTRKSLRLAFKLANGKQFLMSIPFVDTNTAPANIRALINAVIDNNTAFAEGHQPVEYAGAEFVVTSRTTIDVPAD